MPSYRYIDDFIPGDTYKLIRELDSVVDAQTLVAAWWTIKSSMNDSDAQAAAQFTITTAASGIGYITNYDDGTAQVLFIANNAQTGLMSPNSTYYYDIQVRTSGNETYTLEVGKLFTTYATTGAI